MIKRVFVILLAIVLSVQIKASDYKKVDKYARSIHKSGNYRDLAKKLVAPFSDNEEKVRSIFIWVTHNIKYDYRKFKKNQRRRGYSIKGRSKKEIAIKRRKLRERKIAHTYRVGKGVCEDYSYLFQSMCKAVGIEASYITGVTKSSPNQIGKYPQHSAHAWNAVKINGKWYLLDATWAAGTVNHKTGRFKRDYQDGFFLTSPRFFIMNHYPDNKKWQLLSKPVSKEEFKNFPYLHGEFFALKDIVDFFPKSAYLNAKKKYNIVKIKYKGKIPNIVMLRRGKMIKLEYSIKNNEIALKIPTLAKYHRHVVLGVKRGRRFAPLLEYKIK